MTARRSAFSCLRAPSRRANDPDGGLPGSFRLWFAELWAYYVPSQFKLTTPPENVSTYQWGSKTVRHGFCAICGCGTFTETPDFNGGEPDFDNPKISVNARLFDGFDLDAVEVVVIDGKNLW